MSYSVRLSAQNPDIIAQRKSNSLVRDATATTGGTAENTIVFVLGKLMGGLWVGGTTYLTREAITFQPNGLNVALHDNECSATIPLREVTAVRQRFGFVTQIIDIHSRNRTLTIRCFGASSFVKAIRNARN